jgi:hypothetical protein
MWFFLKRKTFKEKLKYPVIMQDFNIPMSENYTQRRKKISKSLKDLNSIIMKFDLIEILIFNKECTLLI